MVIGFLGSTLDAGGTAARWEKWRPTVSICQHEDFLVHRLELLYARPHQKLAEQLVEDIASASPETTVKLHLVDPRDPWDFQEVYGMLARIRAQLFVRRGAASATSCTSRPAPTSRRSACSC